MEAWMPFFVAVVAISVVIQTVLLAVMFTTVTRATRRVEQVTAEVQGRIKPILSRIQTIVDESQPRIASITADAAEMTHLARTQVQRMDRVVADALDKLRSQLVHADEIVSEALDSVEDTGTKVKNAVWAPVRSVTALFRGIQTGFEFYKERRRETNGDAEDDSLFM